VRVFKNLLLQLNVFDLLSHTAAKTLIEFENGWKNSGRLLSKITEANRFSVDEGRGTTLQCWLLAFD
jgi:hypothetical protein